MSITTKLAVLAQYDSPLKVPAILTSNKVTTLETLRATTADHAKEIGEISI